MRLSDAIGLLVVTGIIASIYYAQKNPEFKEFNLFDLLMENGRLSKLSVAFMTGLVVMSWIMIRLTIDGKMTEGYLGLYGSIIIAPVIARLFSAPTVTGTATTSTTSTTSGLAP